MNAGASGAETTAAVLAIVSVLARETRPGVPTPGPDDDLEHKLGFDSLERAELLRRVEAAFDVSLPPGTLTEARTPADLARAVLAATRGSAIAGLPALPLVGPSVAEVPEGVTTLAELLAWHARTQPDRTHLTLVVETDAGPSARALSYGALHDEALRVAAGLRDAGIAAGEAVAIMLPTSIEFFGAFFGALYAGAVPVPLYPPARRSQLEEHFQRQARIIDNAQAVAMITWPEASGLARLLRAATPSLRSVSSVAALRATAARYAHRPAAADTAFLQYTSGSTGQPKGVVISHANVLANIRAMGQALGVRHNDVFVSWLPLYHDMGLIGAWLGSLYYALPLVIMPPTDFLARPARWLQAIDRYRGTLSAAPNFAYEFCASRIDESALAGLDLSCWRAAFVGSEPVAAETIERFGERFARCGFHPNAMLPVYGLAESAVGLSFPPVARGPRIDRVDRASLALRGVAVPAAAADPNPLRVVGCGHALPGHELRVVDETGRELPERHEGSIEFRGPSATSGYFRNPAATRGLLRGDWRVTGDLGYVVAGELYLTGRSKDLIIRAGQHVHPQEAEVAIGAIPGVRKGCVSVFGVAKGDGTGEKVVVLAETRETDPGRRESLRAGIAALCLSLFGAPVDDIVLARPHTVLKTSSGKIRRAACADLYRRGMLRAGTTRVWPQLIRVLAASGLGLVTRWMFRAGDLAFAAWAWGLFTVGAVGASIVVTLWPRPDTRRRALAALARALLRASGLPLRLPGPDAFPARGPVTVVANHASYLDAILLQAVLPDYCAFVAKKELARHALLRYFLARIGVHRVERFEVAASVEDAGDLVAAARKGASLVFFPEGTLRREPGLGPFHAGAFVAAAMAGTPVLPVALRGTRSVLRDGQWRPRRGPIEILVAPPLMPGGVDWPAVVNLRDQARAEILARCEEPDLDRRGPVAA